MPKGYPPSVFVSSTCFDLKHVREQLKYFLEGLGLSPILSEYNSFPVNPSEETISNCLNVVKDRADIFILIIGRRYGFETTHGKSITNLEYLHAQSFNIPVFVFVDKEVWTLYGEWLSNPGNNYKNIDSIKVFEFVKTIQESQKWIFQYDSTENITDTIRKQLAILFSESLILRKSYYDSKVPASLQEADPSLLRLYIERPPFWEYRFFIASFVIELNKYQWAERDLEIGLIHDKGINMQNPIRLGNWIGVKFHELEAIVNSMKALLDKSNGNFNNPDISLYVTRRFADLYGKIILWMLEFKSVKTKDEMQKLIEITAGLPKDVINAIQAFKIDLPKKFEDAIAKATNGENVTASGILTFPTLYGLDEFTNELARIKKTYLTPENMFSNLQDVFWN